MATTPARAHRAGICVLAAAFCTLTCVDVSPVSERSRLLLFAPSETGARLDSALGPYYAAHGDVVRVVYGPSAELVRRVAGERTAALLVVSHPTWAEYVERRRTVLERAAFAQDRLVVAALDGAGQASAPLPGDATEALDVARWLESDPSARIAVPSTESDAVGMYAREALLRYGIWVRVRPLLETVSDTPAALARLRTGAVGAAILFASVAEAEGLTTVATVDPALHRPIRFEILLLADDHANARPLFDFLVSAGRAAPAATAARR